MLIAAVLLSCGEHEPSTREEKRVCGEALLTRMSNRLATARTIRFSTREELDLAGRSGEKYAHRRVRLARDVKLRRPGCLWFRVTGDLDLEGFYHGESLVVLSHEEKSFSRILMPPTLDQTVEVLSSRYRSLLPMGPLLEVSPRGALLNRSNRLNGDTPGGGWTGEEDVDGVRCTRFEWRYPNADWVLWIPVMGEPLPRKLQIAYKEQRGLPRATVLFESWSLGAEMSDATFSPRIKLD